MTPQEKLEFERLKEIVSRLERVESVPFIESVTRRIKSGNVTAKSGASTTGTSIVVRNAADTGSETVAANYSGVLTLEDSQGNTYRIGYYT